MTLINQVAIKNEFEMDYVKVDGEEHPNIYYLCNKEIPNPIYKVVLL